METEVILTITGKPSTKYRYLEAAVMRKAKRTFARCRCKSIEFHGRIGEEFVSQTSTLLRYKYRFVVIS